MYDYNSSSIINPNTRYTPSVDLSTTSYLSHSSVDRISWISPYGNRVLSLDTPSSPYYPQSKLAFIEQRRTSELDRIRRPIDDNLIGNDSILAITDASNPNLSIPITALEFINILNSRGYQLSEAQLERLTNSSLSSTNVQSSSGPFEHVESTEDLPGLSLVKSAGILTVLLMHKMKILYFVLTLSLLANVGLTGTNLYLIYGPEVNTTSSNIYTNTTVKKSPSTTTSTFSISATTTPNSTASTTSTRISTSTSSSSTTSTPISTSSTSTSTSISTTTTLSKLIPLIIPHYPSRRCILYRTDYTDTHDTVKYMCNIRTERCITDDLDCALNGNCCLPIGWCLPLPAPGGGHNCTKHPEDKLLFWPRSGSQKPKLSYCIMFLSILLMSFH